MDEPALTPKMIAIYARVSTARQEEEETIKTQLVAIREFAAQKEYIIVREYLDDGWSGDMLARPGLDELRQDAKKGLWTAVLFYDPDRLARRYSYQALVMEELTELRVEPLFVTIPPSKNDEDRLLYGVRGVFAEYERTKITERFRLGKLRKAKEGHVIASEAPYGYTFVRKTEQKQGYYEINEVEARVVRMIFSWIVNESLTIRMVVRRLQENGIPPRKSKRGVWSTSTLGSLLRNATYIGEGHYGASYAVVPERPLKKEGYRKIKKTSRRNRPESEWIKIATPSIIDKELYMRAQLQLKRNFELSSRNKKNQYLLANKIRCICGRSRAGEGPQRGKYLYYRCTGRVHSYPLPPTCTERGVNARLADELVWSKVAQLMSSKQLMLRQARRWIDARNNKSRDSIADIEALRNQVTKFKSEEGRYMKAYGAGFFTMEELREYIVPIRNKTTNLEKQIASAHAMGEELNHATIPQADEVETFAAKATAALQNLNFEGKKAIVMNVIDRVVATPNELRVSGFVPVNSESHVQFQTSDRYGVDTTRYAASSPRVIPFELHIKLPMPLRTGIDYGFLPGKNTSSKGKAAAFRIP
jgi:site-specific DNA recombinase